MNYTKQQLEAPLGEVIMKGLTLTELENPLEWKKWRVVKHKSVKANQEEKYWFTVEAIKDEPNWSILQKGFFLYFFGLQGKPNVKLSWQPYYEGYEDPTEMVFKTQQEANEFIQSEITRLTPTVKTSKIVSVQPE